MGYVCGRVRVIALGLLPPELPSVSVRLGWDGVGRKRVRIWRKGMVSRQSDFTLIQDSELGDR
jgi:hypothetical protein